MVTLAIADALIVVLAGVNVTESVRVPAASTDPAGGAYANVPGTLALALNCVAPSAVPYAIGAGFAHVMVGVVFNEMLIAADVVTRPAASLAWAVSVWTPVVRPVVFHATV
jgi:hypothetical protein